MYSYIFVVYITASTFSRIKHQMYEQTMEVGKYRQNYQPFNVRTIYAQHAHASCSILNVQH